MESWCDLWKNFIHFTYWMVGVFARRRRLPFGRRVVCVRDERKMKHVAAWYFASWFCACIRCIRKSYLLEIGKISFGLERCKWNRTFAFSKRILLSMII